MIRKTYEFIKFQYPLSLLAYYFIMLNDFGKLAIAELVFYTPLLLLTLAVTLRYGFDRREGWILLFMFANGSSDCMRYQTH